MISLPQGTWIVKYYDAEMRKVGKGVLYLLNRGMIFEKQKEGVRFECAFEDLGSFEATKRDRLLVVMRTPKGRKSVEFKVEPANQVEYDITEANQEYAKGSSAKNKVDQDALSRSEARWFQENWDEIMKFLTKEKVSYLEDYVKSAKTGTPYADPYLLVVDYENLSYKDFADLPGFLRWRYRTITDKEVAMICDVFRDFDGFSARTLEMQYQRASQSKNYLKFNRSLYEHIAINSREIAESLSQKMSNNS